MLIRIKNLRLRAITGINDWERKDLQEVVINAAIEYHGEHAVETDSIEDGLNYRTIAKRIIQEVETSRYQLLDTLAARILAIIMEQQKVFRATVEVDKPHALRFADSVSVSLSAEREP
jgi:D-erythro-7,8-dihydroneopterin triphosphate epimerase